MSQDHKGANRKETTQQQGPPPGMAFGRGPMGLGAPIQKAKDAKGTMKRLLGYLKQHRMKIFVIFLTAILSTLFGIISPKIMGKVTTHLFTFSIAKFKGTSGVSIDFDYIGNILLLLLGLYLVSALFTFIQQYIVAGLAQKIVFKLRKDVQDKLVRLPLKFFDSRTHGEILSRATNDVDNIGTTTQQVLSQLISNIVLLIGTIVMMFTISFWLTLIALITLPLSILITKKISSYSKQYFVSQQKSIGELNGHVEEMYGGHTIVKAFGHEDKSVEKFSEINDKLYDSGWRAQFISGIIMPLMMFVGNIGYVLVSVVGGVFVTTGAITIGNVQAFIQYSQQFTMPITQVASIANLIQSALASGERVFELLDEEEEIPESAVEKSLASPRGSVSFENVKFGYKAEEPVIENMSIKIHEGQTVAIVGPTGAGKTTLVNLLMRFYEIDGGRIVIDGVDIRDMKRSRLRNLFGMVLQDTWLFNGTIRDNIAYGREGASEDDVVQAAKAAYADHFIRTLPEGYDTLLNEEASNLSQGQKQLLTIARAILADPAILILDEATSSVDTRTEMHIQKAMTELMQGRTSFVIAHRLSTIREADLILVMKGGTVIEQGTHHELIEMNGFYTELYNSQFAVGA
ncbi:ABC transporter ATP-binding protein [Paenibacillus psychroresistens]|uniref:ABC transporter ATP-binding protein n=1 Tax=Paenibacillus psychroresistens TaxID=1778678 RepID=A0A6B8RWW6_9BACL|nr:ABC transporter ATP-binding protein [Paenibacillus psychroresistens]